jgi:shikimate dehydrogenase
MHEAGFRELGLDANYLVLELDPEAFKKTMRGLSASLLSGFNVTVPYKETVMKYLGKVSPGAKAIGAVNTVYKKGGKWAGTNTDMEGFLISLAREGKFDPKGKKAVVLGGGGASRAVTYGLAQKGAKEIAVVDAVPEKAQKIVRGLRRSFRALSCRAFTAGAPEVRDLVEAADLVINATPLGLKKTDPLVVPLGWIPRVRKGTLGPKLFMDLIYNPSETVFLKTAKARGHRVLNGLGMLLYQGVRAFECWTGRRAPVPVMRRALLEALQGKK